MHLKNSKKIVIKIGSSLLIDKSKKIRLKWLTGFSKDIKELLDQNKKVIIVSSGAIAIGCKKLNLNKKNVEEIVKNFSKNKKCEVITLSTFNKDAVTKIKAKLLNYVS